MVSSLLFMVDIMCLTVIRFISGFVGFLPLPLKFQNVFNNKYLAVIPLIQRRLQYNGVGIGRLLLNSTWSSLAW